MLETSDLIVSRDFKFPAKFAGILLAISILELYHLTDPTSPPLVKAQVKAILKISINCTLPCATYAT